jgi:hypothetical protein
VADKADAYCPGSEGLSLRFLPIHVIHLLMNALNNRDNETEVNTGRSL